MKIAVNTRLLVSGKLEGIGVFTSGILRTLTRNHPEHEFVFIFDRPFDRKFVFSGNVRPVVLFPPTRHPILLHFWLECRIPRILKKTNSDVFLSPDGFLSLSSKVPSVSIIHDICFFHRPRDLPFFHSWHANRFFPEYARKANRVITCSNFCKADIRRHFHVDAGKIETVKVGADERFRPSSKERVERTRRELASGAPYFLYTGSLHPRKNIVNLMNAFDQFKTETRSDVKLVIVGRKMFKARDIFRTYDRLKYRKDVVFTGYVDFERLVAIYGAALALVYVSFFEGFGLPLAEAMRCEIPIVTSNVTAMPEIAGDAAVKVDPANVSDIAGAMKKIALDSNLRNELVAAGRTQRENFGYEKASRIVWNCIEQAAESKNG